MLFGIVQGATFEDLRKQSAQAIVHFDFDGYAIGGVSVGEPEEEMMRAVECAEPFLPGDKPRYAMGLGTPPQLLELIARGVGEDPDLVDELREEAGRIAAELSSNGLTEIKLVQEHIHDAIGQVVYDRTRRRPMILPVVIEV